MRPCPNLTPRVTPPSLLQIACVHKQRCLCQNSEKILRGQRSELTRVCAWLFWAVWLFLLYTCMKIFHVYFTNMHQHILSHTLFGSAKGCCVFKIGINVCVCVVCKRESRGGLFIVLETKEWVRIIKASKKIKLHGTSERPSAVHIHILTWVSLPDLTCFTYLPLPWFASIKLFCTDKAVYSYWYVLTMIAVNWSDLWCLCCHDGRYENSWMLSNWIIQRLAQFVIGSERYCDISEMWVRWSVTSGDSSQRSHQFFRSINPCVFFSYSSSTWHSSTAQC